MLKRKEIHFIDEYMKDFNGTRAAIAAGYTENRASAATIADRLLRKVEISAEIEKKKVERSQRLELSVDDIVKEIQQLGMAQGWTMDDKGLSTKFNALKFLYEHVKTTGANKAKSFSDLILELTEEENDSKGKTK